MKPSASLGLRVWGFSHQRPGAHAALAPPASHRVLTLPPWLLGVTHTSRGPLAIFPALLPACPLCVPGWRACLGTPSPASLA